MRTLILEKTKFKNFTNQEIKKAEKIAYQALYSTYNMRMNVRFRYDARTRVGSLSAAIYYTEEGKLNKVAIYNKRRKRIANKPEEYTNILNNKIYNDWKKNKSQAQVYNNHIRFQGRNHWAKNTEDLKVLSIIKKYSKY